MNPYLTMPVLTLICHPLGYIDRLDLYPISPGVRDSHTYEIPNSVTVIDAYASLPDGTVTHIPDLEHNTLAPGMTVTVYFPRPV